MKKATLWLGAATVVAGIVMQRPATAAEMFADVPTDHWAYQAVNRLQERGIVIGYPDGTFGGKRAMTRYEFAVAVDRLVEWVNRSMTELESRVNDRMDKIEGQLKNSGATGLTEEQVNALIDARVRNLPTREDLEAIRRLTEEFKDELAALGTNVEGLRRDLDSLRARVGAIEERLNRWHFSGEANLIERGERGDRSRMGINAANVRRPVIDLDSRTDNNGTDDLLNGLKSLYSLDFGITGNISPGVTANALLNVGNYLPWVNSNRQNPGVYADAIIPNPNAGGYAVDISRVQAPGNQNGPISPSGVPQAPLTGVLSPSQPTQGNFGTLAINNSFSEFSPVKLYLSGRISNLLFLKDVDATVGKFGVQFTPYTLRQVDPDSYTNVTLTDNGEVIGVGGMAHGLIGSDKSGLHLTGFAMTNYNGRSVNTGYPMYISWGGPPALSAMTYGAYDFDQTDGVRGTLKFGRFNIGGTYLEAGLSPPVPNSSGANPVFSNDPYVNRINPNNGGRRMDPRRGQVFGGDLSFPIAGGLGFTGEFASSNTLAGVKVGDRKGVYPSNLRNAYDAKLNWGAGNLSVSGGYKRVDPFFGAPGAWGNIGRWKNPTNIEGWNANAGYNFGGFTLRGGYEDYNSVKVDARGRAAVASGVGIPILTDAFENDIKHYSAGINFNLTPSNGVDLGWEQSRLKTWDRLGTARETYWTVGLGHNFNQNTLIKVEYQMVDYKDNGAGIYTIPNGGYKGGIGITQLSVRF